MYREKSAEKKTERRRNRVGRQLNRNKHSLATTEDKVCVCVSVKREMFDITTGTAYK